MKDYEPHKGILALLGFVQQAEWYTGRDTCIFRRLAIYMSSNFTTAKVPYNELTAWPNFRICTVTS